MKIQDIQVGDLYHVTHSRDSNIRAWALVTRTEVVTHLDDYMVWGYDLDEKKEILVLVDKAMTQLDRSDSWIRAVYRNGEKLP